MNGRLLGTVYQDAEGEGRAAYNIARELANGRPPSSSSTGFDIVDGHYVWIPYTPMPGGILAED